MYNTEMRGSKHQTKTEKRKKEQATVAVNLLHQKNLDKRTR